MNAPQHGSWHWRSDTCVKDVLERTKRQRARIHTNESTLAERPPQRHGERFTLLRDPVCHEQPDWLVANATGREPGPSAEA